MSADQDPSSSNNNFLNSSFVDRVFVVGAGRMGQGIAVAFSYAGVPVTLIDFKQRSAQERKDTAASVTKAIAAELNFFLRLGTINLAQYQAATGRISFTTATEVADQLVDSRLVFEAVPEVIEVKKNIFCWLCKVCGHNTILASTTSTFLLRDISQYVERPQRFINTHWLNPAHLMPLIEISKTDFTDIDVISYLQAVLKRIGKIPVVCKDSPGYIVPRIQALAMNEAARLVEEGVASAEDVDIAIRVGFGPRFSVLGLLEFIDWGGGDILYYASQYLSGKLGERFKAPKIITTNMSNGHNGLRDKQGFYDYQYQDVEAYRADRLGSFIKLLKSMQLLPKFEGALTDHEK